MKTSNKGIRVGQYFVYENGQGGTLRVEALIGATKVSLVDGAGTGQLAHVFADAQGRKLLLVEKGHIKKTAVGEV